MAAISGSALVAGGVMAAGMAAGGIAGAMGSKGQKTSATSGINLAPTGSLQELLQGAPGQLTPAQKDQKRLFEEEIARIQSKIDKSRAAGIPDDNKTQKKRMGMIDGVKAQIGELELQAPKQGGQLENFFNQLTDFVNTGPGLEDVKAGTQAQRDFAQALQQYADTSGLPSEELINQAGGFAQNIFAPQQVALNQAFQQQNTDSMRARALQGRSAADPILAAKLGQSQAEQTALLQAQQGAFQSQLALQLPQQQIQALGQRADILLGLGNQAMNNRMSLLGQGSALLGAERQFQIATSEQFQTGRQSGQGGGVMGGITGALGGLGAGAGAANSIQGIFGMGGGGGLGGGNITGFNPGTMDRGIMVPGAKIRD